MSLARVAKQAAPKVIVPRDYQEWGVKELMQWFHVNRGKGNPLVAMPTGTGKSLIPPLFCRAALTSYDNIGRHLIVTHSQDLVEQNEIAFRACCPDLTVGVIAAGFKRKELDQQITIAMIQSIFRKPEMLGKIDMCWVDEAQTIGPKETSMYQKLFTYLKIVAPWVQICGLTATPFRMGSGSLLDGKDALFTDIAVDMTHRDVINWFVAQGYLVPLIEKRTTEKLDFSQVHLQAGEMNSKEANEVVTKEGVTEAALNETIYYGQTQNRRKWLVFAQGVEHAEFCAEYLNRQGIPTACVHSDMHPDMRIKILAEYRLGRYRAITNYGVLTTGFDDKDIDLIAMLRGTHSAGLWVQMLGRGTRPIYALGFDLSTQAGRLAAIAASPKQNCLVLDFANNIYRCGPFNDPVIPKAKGKGPKGVAPVRTCPQCDKHCHASLKQCDACAYVFPENINFSGTAGTEAIMVGSGDEENKRINEVPVTRVEYKKHNKPGRPPSLEVSYYAGLTRFRDWWCLEHEGWPAQEARRSWRNASGGSKPPETIDEAMERLGDLRAPVSLRVWIKPKHSDVLGVSYS